MGREPEGNLGPNHDRPWTLAVILGPLYTYFLKHLVMWLSPGSPRKEKASILSGLGVVRWERGQLMQWNILEH